MNNKQLNCVAVIYWEQVIQYVPVNSKRFGLIETEKPGDCLCRGQDILPCSKNQSSSTIKKEWRETFSTKNMPDWVREEIVKIEIKQKNSSER